MSADTGAPEHAAAVPRPMVLDRVIPEHCASLARHAIVAAPPEVTYDAIARTDAFGDRAVRALFDLRVAPQRVVAKVKGAAAYEAMPPSVTFAQVFDTPGGFHPLGADPPHEILAGMIGKFWQKDLQIVDFAGAEEFIAFDEPDFCKTVADFSVRPYGATRSLLSYESRTAATDPEARRKFRRYWVALRPGIAYVMGSALRLIRAEAERAQKGA